jgi:pectate lyase
MSGIYKPGGGSGSSTFTGLTDTPSSYTGEAGKVPVVNVGEDALEFQAISITNVVTTVNDDYSIEATDNVVLVDTSTQAIVITIPTAQLISGRKITIKDMGGSTIHPIAIVREDGGEIDDEEAYVLNNNYDSVTLECDGTQWWVV